MIKVFSRAETMELLQSNKNKITKDENGISGSHLEITERVLVHCLLSTVIIKMIQESCICSYYSVWSIIKYFT